MVDIIENISKDVKWAQFRKKMDTLRDEPAMPPRFESAERSKSLFLKSYEEGDEELDEKVVSYYQAPIDIRDGWQVAGRQKRRGGSGGLPHSIASRDCMK